MDKIHVFCFSPTGKTAIVAYIVAQRLSTRLQLPIIWSDYTLPSQRESIERIGKSDLVIWASPVYAGKTPNLLLPFVKEVMRGKGNPIVLLATYGNRSYDNVLAEMFAIAKSGKMKAVAAAAVVAQHAFAETLGAGRPNAQDRHELEMFADAIDVKEEIRVVPGLSDAPYYQPKKGNGTPAIFLKALPEVDETKCDKCGRCVRICPLGSIKMVEHVSFFTPCIKCMACVKSCPHGAIAITDEEFQGHRRMLIKTVISEKENTFIV